MFIAISSHSAYWRFLAVLRLLRIHSSSAVQSVLSCFQSGIVSWLPVFGAWADRARRSPVDASRVHDDAEKIILGRASLRYAQPCRI